MTFKLKIRALVGALAVLAILFAVSVFLSPEMALTRAVAGRLSADKTPVDAVEITLSKSGTSLSLLKGPAGWTVRDKDGEWPCDPGKPDAFLKALDSVTELVPVSASRDSLPSFGLDAQAATVLVKGKDGKALADFQAGKDDSSGNGVYVRKSGSDGAFSASSVFKSYLVAERRMWADFRVFGAAIKEESVLSVKVKARVTLDREAKKELLDEYRLTRDAESGWVHDRGATPKLDGTKVDSMVRALLGMKGEDFSLASPAEASLDKPAATVELALRDGSTATFLVGKEAGDGRFFVKGSTSGRVLVASRYSLESAAKNLKDLVAQN